MEKKKYPVGAEHYTLHEEIGQGVSGSVHRALCKPYDEIVAIKILDLERADCDLFNISREAQTMIMVDHPNVLKCHCSFVSDYSLWIVMPYMSGGSCLHILKAAYPTGFGEVVIATILKEVLKGLEYLHNQGHIHRDVKAGNILIGSRGTVKLGDFGVSCCLFDSCDRHRMRNTFVGTPCWMAPEVMEQLHGYDFKADIWSFGITALELARGNAPFSQYPPMKVLLMTLQNAPPGLDYERDRKYSKHFKQMIAICLVKDPVKRPSAKKLLKHPFFKQAKSNDYIVRTLLEGLPNLGDRIKALKKKEEDMVAQKKMPDGEKEEISQNEYKRGISVWNFDLEDVKAQASLIQDNDDMISSSNSFVILDGEEKTSQCQSSSQAADSEWNDKMPNQAVPLPSVDPTSNDMKSYHEDRTMLNSSPKHDARAGNSSSEIQELEFSGGTLECAASSSDQQNNVSAGGTLLEVSVSPTKRDRDKLQNQLQNIPNCSSSTLPQAVDDMPSEVSCKQAKSASSSSELDEKGRSPVVQQKGRFKVTSENVSIEKVAPTPILLKSQSMQVITTPYSTISNPSTPLLSPLPSPSARTSTLSGPSTFHLLHSILQSNINQGENILSIMKHVATLGDFAVKAGCSASHVAAVEKSLLEAAHDRETQLLNEITDLQSRLTSAQAELQKLRTENTKG